MITIHERTVRRATEVIEQAEAKGVFDGGATTEARYLHSHVQNVESLHISPRVEFTEGMAEWLWRLILRRRMAEGRADG